MLLSLFLLQLFFNSITGFQNFCENDQICDCITSNGATELHCPKDDPSIIIETSAKFAKIQCLTLKNLTSLPKIIKYQKPESLSIYYCPESLKLSQFVNTQNIKTLRLFFNGEYFNIKKEDLEYFDKLNILEINDATLTVERNVFKNTSNLRILALRNTQLKDIDHNLFNDLKDLKFLDLSENQITKIPDAAFRNLDNLKTLMLWKNNLTNLQKDAFTGLKKLTVLELYGNKIDSMHWQTFSSLEELRILNLKHNNIEILSEDTFERNRNLDELNLSKNKIGYLPENIFKNLNNIKKLIIQRTKITKLPNNIFKGLNTLTTLDLSWNTLDNIPENIFASLDNLEILNLEENHIKEIAKDTFIGLNSLKKLNLNRNKIYYVNTKSLIELTNLQKIDLSFNQWTFPLNGATFISVFSSCSELQDINLSYNRIERFPSELTEFLPQLKFLNLSYNPIDYMSVSEFTVTVPDALIVDVSSTKITTLDFFGAKLTAEENLEYNDKQNLEFKTTVFLNNTELKCGCENYDLLLYNAGFYPNVKLLLDIQQTTAYCENSTKTRKFLDVAPQDCVYNDQNHCPEKCECNYRPFNKTLAINCSYQNLTEFPKLNFSKTSFEYILDLEGNLLKHVPDDLKAYEDVTILNLRNNEINEIFWIPDNIKEIYLDNNQLQSVNRSFIEKLTNLTQLKKITLSGNPWTCDCNARHFQQFLIEFHGKVNSSEILCSEDMQPLTKNTNLCPQPFFLIITLPILLTALFLVAVATAFYYRYEEYIKAYLYSKGWLLWLVTEEDVDKDKIYDVFLSYAHQDAVFIENILLKELEECGYKVCVHFRDFIPGEYIPTNIANSVQSSRRTVIVLSTNFIKSVWGRLEFRTAHTESISEKRSRIIVIIYDDLDFESLDEELKNYLKMNTYIKWGDKYFWHKLKYALPHNDRHGGFYRKNQQLDGQLVKISNDSKSHLATTVDKS